MGTHVHADGVRKMLGNAVKNTHPESWTSGSESTFIRKMCEIRPKVTID